jgi:hypothetical protein
MNPATPGTRAVQRLRLLRQVKPSRPARLSGNTDSCIRAGANHNRRPEAYWYHRWQLWRLYDDGRPDGSCGGTPDGNNGRHSS